MRNDKIITIPNIITLGRLLLTPFFIIALVYGKKEIAVLLFAAIALGDGLDGLSARIMKQKTRIGSLLDSVTDWLVILSVLITFIFIKTYLLISIIILFLIPAGIILVTKGIYIMKRKKIIPTVIGKVATAFAYITIITFLINFTYKNLFLITMVILAYATMFYYIIKDVKLFID